MRPIAARDEGGVSLNCASKTLSSEEHQATRDDEKLSVEEAHAKSMTRHLLFHHPDPHSRRKVLRNGGGERERLKTGWYSVKKILMDYEPGLSI